MFIIYGRLFLDSLICSMIYLGILLLIPHYLDYWMCVCVCVCARAHLSFSHVQLFAIPWTIAFQASLSMEFSRQEYWSGLPFPNPVYLPYPGIEHMSLSRSILYHCVTWEVHLFLRVGLKTGSDAQHQSQDSFSH